MDRRVVVLLLALALVVRLGYVAATPGYQAIDDAHNYDVHARSIAAGHGFARIGSGPSGETAFRPPGYPYLLAGVYALSGVDRAEASTRYRAGRVANALVGTAIVALIGVLAAQLFDRRVALVAMALAALYLPLILVGGTLMSEPLFAALLLGALAAALHHRRSAHRYRWALMAGVLGGLAILTRANAAILLAPLAIAVWNARPRWSWRALAPPIALVAIALVTVSPWTIRNAVVFHSFVPVTTQLGTALAGTYNDAARTDRDHPASWRSLRRVPDYQYLIRRWRQIPEPVLDRRLRAAALRYAAHHPGYVAEVVFWDTARALDLAGMSWSRHTASTISIGPRWADAGVVCFWLVAALAIAGALTSRGRRVPAFVIAVPALLFLSVAFFVFETPRYRTGIDPFIVMLASVALVTGWDVARSAGLRHTRPERDAPELDRVARRLDGVPREVESGARYRNESLGAPMEHVHSEHVAADPDRVFAALKDPESLARFVPQLTKVEQSGERVEVEARYEGRTQRGDAYFRADEPARRVEWGAESGYRGWLEVSPDEGGSILTLGLHTTHIEHSDHDVAGTLDAMRRLVEAQV